MSSKVRSFPSALSSRPSCPTPASGGRSSRHRPRCASSLAGTSSPAKSGWETIWSLRSKTTPPQRGEPTPEW
eukprot:6987831-Heterocapsa_arctica.AAC.1